MISFYFWISWVNQNQRTSAVLGRSHMEAFTDMTKLVESFGLVESVLWCHMSHDLPQPIRLNSLGLKLRDSEIQRQTHSPDTEGAHSVDWIRLIGRWRVGCLWRCGIVFCWSRTFAIERSGLYSELLLSY